MAKETVKSKAAPKTAKTETKKPDEKPKIICRCSFCGKSANLAHRLIAGPNDVFICDECVGVCVKILADNEGGLLWLKEILSAIDSVTVEVPLIKVKINNKTATKAVKTNAKKK